MNVGLFISGLGEAYEGVSLRNYAARWKNEMDLSTKASLKYFLKEEKLEYYDGCTTHRISVFSKDGAEEKEEYVFYDFVYTGFLTKDYEEKSVISKSFMLVTTVFSKFPVILLRLLKSGGRGYQSHRLRLLSFYMFCIFLILSVAGIMLIPSVLALIGETIKQSDMANYIDMARITEGRWAKPFNTGLLIVISAASTVFAFFPNSRTAVTRLAAEFTCVHHYLEYGRKKQVITGHLDKLVEFILETEMERAGGTTDVKLQLHSYSFGTIIALDLLFPYVNPPAKHVEEYCNGLVTIGCPYEFISSYYRQYFKLRNGGIKNIKWYNVYSASDALSSNFRNDAKDGDPQFAISENVVKPRNIRYELSPASPTGVINFFMLYQLRAHRFYWDNGPEGQSCLRSVYDAFKTDTMLSELIERA